MISRPFIGQGYRTISVEEQFELARWSTGNALLIGGIVTAVFAYAVIWLYRHEGRGRMSRRMRRTLMALRLAALGLIGLIALEPVLVRYEERRQDATTLVLVDSSASMGIADRYRAERDQQMIRAMSGGVPDDGIERTAVCETILFDTGRGIFDRLAERNRVTLMGFDRTAAALLHLEHQAGAASPHFDAERADAGSTGLDADAQRSRVALTANGNATDLGAGVRSALESAAGAPVAGIVILTDGRFNRGEPASQVARALRRLNTPVYVVGIGDPSPPVNLRVAEVAAPRSAFKNDPFRVSATIEARGIVGEAIRAELWERRAEDAEPRRVEDQPVVFREDDGVATVSFERKVDTPGEVSYSVRLPKLAEEAVAQDNTRDLAPSIHILDDRMKVLLISGGPSYDYRFLSRLLERDATVELSTWLQSADINAVRDGNVVLTALPIGTEEINKYDAIILMDVDPRELDPTWSSVVATFVTDYGGGVMYAAGNKNTGAFFREDKTQPIVSILPIVPDPEAEILINELGHYQLNVWPVIVPVDAVGDPILRQTDDAAETRDVWAMLGGVYWHFPVRREKPVARRLMEHSNPRMVNAYGPHVLFATQYVGSGRSAFLAIDTTWRWRRGDERPFNRFWIQTLRFLVEGKLLGGRARGQIMTQQDVYETGDAVSVEVRALTAGFQPLLLPEMTMSVTTRSGSPEEAAEDVTLQPVAGREGHYDGRFQLRSAGTVKLEISLPTSATAGGAATIEKELLAVEPDLEMRETAMDEATLRTLAQAAGGDSRYLTAAEAFDLPSLIEDQSRTTRHRGRVRAAWDNGTVFLLFVLLLTAEWALRKVAKLI